MSLARILRPAITVLALTCAVEVISQCGNDNTLYNVPATPPCPGSTTVACVWGGEYVLVNVVFGNSYTFSTCGGAAWDTQITLFDNAGGASLGYNDDGCGLQSSITWVATFTGQLRVLLDQWTLVVPCASNTTCAALTITCAAPPPPVTNADPCGAIAIALVLNCGGATYTNVGGGSSATTPLPTCGNFIAGTSQDVWFTFVAGPYGSVNLQSTAGTLADGAMAVYSATSCAGPFTQVACDDDSGPGFMPQLNLNGLTPGQTYFVRYWGYGAATGTFTLCIQGVTTVPPGGCVYTLNLFDAFADGWGTSYVGVSINGGAFQNYTVTGASNIVYIPVTIGSVIVLNYDNSGAFQTDNSYSLTLGAGSVFNSGSPPTAGIAYAGTLSCNPPPAPPEDCIGSITLCSNQAFNNNTSNTGNVADLNPTSAGCLLNTERQGTWYNFTPSASGQIGFTINPSNPLDDYDFAIWGPFPPGSTPSTICPPLAAPLRCSYAAPSGATGLDYVAADQTETAAGDKWVQYLNVTVGQVYLLYVSNWSQSGLAFGLTWDLQGGASLDCTQLGIGLLELAAHDQEQGVLVDWTSMAGFNVTRYEVERQNANGVFVPIADVDAFGDPAVPVHYEYLDRSAPGGLLQYRLQMVQPGGGRVTSNAVMVFRGGTSPGLALVPNPSTSSATICFDADADGKVLIELLDARGRLLRAGTFGVVQGPGRIDWSVAGNEPGTYLVRVTLPGGSVLQERLSIVR